MERAPASARAARTPFTIRRLAAIRPGQRVRYYSGDKNKDLVGAPAVYCRFVESIFDFARRRFLAGLVELREETRIIAGSVEYPQAVTVTDYVAVGKVRKS